MAFKSIALALFVLIYFPRIAQSGNLFFQIGYGFGVTVLKDDIIPDIYSVPDISQSQEEDLRLCQNYTFRPLDLSMRLVINNRYQIENLLSAESFRSNRGQIWTDGTHYEEAHLATDAIQVGCFFPFSRKTDRTLQSRELFTEGAGFFGVNAGYQFVLNKVRYCSEGILDPTLFKHNDPSDPTDTVKTFSPAGSFYIQPFVMRWFKFPGTTWVMSVTFGTDIHPAFASYIGRVFCSIGFSPFFKK